MTSTFCDGSSDVNHNFRRIPKKTQSNTLKGLGSFQDLFFVSRKYLTFRLNCVLYAMKIISIPIIKLKL